jgi:hypothetical protein
VKLSAFLIPAQEGGYVGYNPETGTTSQGKSDLHPTGGKQTKTEQLVHVGRF